MDTSIGARRYRRGEGCLDVIIEFGHVIYGVYDFCTLSKGDDICHMCARLQTFHYGHWI